jgi:hypothetical protein
MNWIGDEYVDESGPIIDDTADLAMLGAALLVIAAVCTLMVLI